MMQRMMARIGAILSVLGVAVVGQLSLGLRGESHTALAQTRISDIVVSGSSGPVGSMGGIALNQADTSGRRVYGVSTTDGQVFVLDTATGQTLSAWGIEKGINNPQTQPLFLVNSIALSDDETRLYAGPRHAFST